MSATRIVLAVRGARRAKLSITLSLNPLGSSRNAVERVASSDSFLFRDFPSAPKRLQWIYPLSIGPLTKTRTQLVLTASTAKKWVVSVVVVVVRSPDGGHLEECCCAQVQAESWAALRARCYSRAQHATIGSLREYTNGLQAAPLNPSNTAKTVCQ